MRRVVLRAFLLLGILGAIPALAVPPNTYGPVIHWLDTSTKSDIPESKRVYVIGPENGTGISGPYASPMLPRHAQNRRVFPFTRGMTLADVVRKVPVAPGKITCLAVYRAGAKPDDKPVFTGRRSDWWIAFFAVRPRDVIHLYYYDQPLAPS